MNTVTAVATATIIASPPGTCRGWPNRRYLQLELALAWLPRHLIMPREFRACCARDAETRQEQHSQPVASLVGDRRDGNHPQSGSSTAGITTTRTASPVDSACSPGCATSIGRPAMSITALATPNIEAWQESTLDEDSARVLDVAHPLGARFPRRLPGGQTGVAVIDGCRSTRAYSIGARFPRRTQAELAQRVQATSTLPASSGMPTGARFPRRRRGDD